MADSVDDLWHECDRGDRTGVTTRLGALGHDEVDAAGHGVDSVANLAAHAADEDAVRVEQVDRLARNAEPGHEDPRASVDHRLDALLDLAG